MKLDKKDRLILINQYKILAKLETADSTYYKELIQILENGYEIFYSLLDQWIDDEMPKENSRFVLSILDVYRAIEDIKRKTKAQEVMEHPYGVFKGFDGNEESDYLGFTRFLIEIQGKYQEQKQYFYKNDHLNSHIPMVDKYQRMLNISDRENIWQMDIETALRILNA